LEKHNPSWGNKVVGSGQVHCVRRLGLPDSEWEKVQPTGSERMFTGERHITCVKMSPEHADEVSQPCNKSCGPVLKL
jgi:WD and tetratricopeptide repeat-containing protein 1